MVQHYFNLDPPPGFRGLHPDLPVKCYQRHLPHWRQDGATYFVTFRLIDSLPQEKLDFLKRIRTEWERTHPAHHNEADWTALAREITTRAEGWLDEGYGVCHFRERKWADELKERLFHFQEDRYLISCWAIMPNHCHLVIRPFDDEPLEDLVGAMKRHSARRINRELSLNGAVWEQEFYDRIIRDEEHLWRVIQYIGRNPRKSGLQHEEPWRRWMHPEWISAGWRFEEN
ncbi:MAG TPA: transposase [Planctomycetaceae bacterium]|nr:transposase [Planctomycetaceae bacterium]